jgi:hypothetical protein
VAYMCKIEGKTTKTLYLSIPQDEVMKTIELNGTISTLPVSYFNMIMILNILQN